MKTIKLIIIIILFFLNRNHYFSQNQAFIYMDSVYINLNGYVEKYEIFTAEKKKYEVEVEKKQKDINLRFESLMANYEIKSGEVLESVKPRMSSKDLEFLNMLQEEYKMIDNYIKSYNNIIDGQFKKDIQPYIDKVNNVIKLYAVKNKLDAIWVMEMMQGQIVYVNKLKDITKDIVLLVNGQLNEKSSKR